MALETWIMHACMVGDAGGIEPACTDAPDAMARRPTGNAKTHSTPSHESHAVAMRRCRAQVASVAAAAAAASLGDKPHQAEAPQSAPDAARGALPSPPHLLHARALSAIGWSLHGHELARLGSPSAAPL